MRKWLASVGTAVLGWGLLGAAQSALGDDRFKGPDEDGTKPALTKIAGEGMMNSHAFEYLTELSDKVGARVEARHCRCGVAFADAPQAACGRHGLDRLDPCERRGRRNRSSEFARPRSGNERHLPAQKQNPAGRLQGHAEEKPGPDLRGVRRLSTHRAQGGGAGRHRRAEWLESQRYESDAYGYPRIRRRLRHPGRFHDRRRSRPARTLPGWRTKAARQIQYSKHLHRWTRGKRQCSRRNSRPRKSRASLCRGRAP